MLWFFACYDYDLSAWFNNDLSECYEQALSACYYDYLRWNDAVVIACILVLSQKICWSMLKILHYAITFLMFLYCS